MSRLVRAAVNDKGFVSFSASPVNIVPANHDLSAHPPLEAGAAVTEVDNYAARIVKYVPAEVIAFYLAADKLFAPVVNLARPDRTDHVLVTDFINTHGQIFAAIIFALALVATPLYIWRQAEPNQPWAVNGIMATMAFIIWAYAVQGGIFSGNGLYDPRLASFTILVFTLLSGFVVPGMGTK